jgi:hypothetical protein
VLAMRAAAMAARVRHRHLLLAAGTLGQHSQGHAGAAVRHGGEGVALAGQDAAVMLRKVGGREALDEAGQGDHFTDLQPME